MKQLLWSVLAAAMVGGCAAPVAQPDAKGEDVGTKTDRLIIPTWWWGDGSACSSILEHDHTYWPPEYIPGEMREYPGVGNDTGTGYGRPGCEQAYITDYQIPYNWWGMNWKWAWIHIAPRSDVSTQWLCENTWTNMRIYSYPHHGAGSDGFLEFEDSRRGNWSSTFQNCDFDMPINFQIWYWHKMLRVVSQSGTWIFPGANHYSYFVTNNDPLVTSNSPLGDSDHR
jgi:hypothetical protein